MLEAHSDVADPERLAALDDRMRALPGAVVALSGGVDSTVLLHACVRVLGSRVLALTADSPSLPRAELQEARDLTAKIGVRHWVVATSELAREGYRRNTGDRCYHCKAALFDAVAVALRDHPEAAWPVLYGAIGDDRFDHRPGARAAAEYGVLAPLADAGWTKVDVRRYAREHGLPNADKPAAACLASRIPTGTAVDVATLAQIERAEAALKALGFRQVRVRHHGSVARLELEPAELARAAGASREAVVQGVKDAGYTFVALDLVGYRTGSLHAH